MIEVHLCFYGSLNDKARELPISLQLKREEKFALWKKRTGQL